MLTQKERERLYLDEARRASSVFPVSEPEASDPLDFIFRCPHGPLGVEVTELCTAEERAAGKRPAYIARDAEQLYTNRPGAVPVEVTFVLARDAADRKVGDLAGALAEFVYQHRDENGAFEGAQCQLPAGYAHIGVFKPTAHEPGGRWMPKHLSATRLASRELLDARISDKNGKLAEYRRRASEVWLLIVNDLWLGPGEVTVRAEDLAEWQFDFAFDKVLLFERQPGGTGTVFELRRA